MSERVRTVSELIDYLSSFPGCVPVRRIYDGMVEPLIVETFCFDNDGDGEFVIDEGGTVGVSF